MLDLKELSLVCPECESGQDVQWNCRQTTGSSGVVDGRLRLHEVSTVFFAGCEACSTTLKIIDGDDVAEMLTQITAIRGIQ